MNKTVSDEKNTALSRIRNKINHKLVAKLFGLMALGAGCGSYVYSNQKEAQEKEKQLIENQENMKNYWKETFPTADEFVFNEKENLYAAIYKIPKDIQKKLAIEYNYAKQTRANVEKRLKVLQKSKDLSEKEGFQSVLTASEEKEYLVLDNVQKQLSGDDERVNDLVKHGNIINMIDFYAPIPGKGEISDSYYEILAGDNKQRSGPTFCYDIGGDQEIADIKNWTDYEFEQVSLKGETATEFAEKRTKNMQETMKDVEKKLRKAGLDKYLGERNDNIEITQRIVKIKPLIVDYAPFRGVCK